MKTLILCTQCDYELCKTLRINRNQFFEQHQAVGLCNGDAVCPMGEGTEIKKII
jgi:hypothetical protein